ncbi:DUF2835 domain-containing protein [Aliikangiella sp. G2MR2-5]|uniref:DUF2835 domain-containing protein n=1 Tax=Aliikangiella sp. G2MR2-5 TaxID=2788943 RepID=UPI0018AB93EE|nr:DUF2835 domain-containing protein [Aliikangiella sp. G2MR2-5]
MQGSEGSDKELEESFSLNISSNEYLRYYKGEVKWVVVTARSGKKIKFPANLLSPFVTHNGINGAFTLRYTAEGKCISLVKNS